MYPTDIAKTRQQLSTSKNVSMWSILRTIASQEGMRNLYRGVSSPIFAEAPKRATKFATNEQYKAWFKCPDGSLPWTRAFLAGALAGATEAFVNCPFETLKVRMQAKEHLSRYRNTADCLVQTVRSEGMLALYRGIEPQMWRNAAWNGTYFAVIGSVRVLFPASRDQSKASQLSVAFASGLVGGGVGTLLNTPLDVVKSRMQNQVGSDLQYRWTLPSLVAIWRAEGTRALYKGLGPRLLRLGPGGGIMIVVFDVVSELLA
jgi:solute carrier family 25 2-oxodicarboxylate transporter 21